MKATERFVLEPDPARTIEGLRDTGYSFDTAVADIIDNSIAADAQAIDLKIEMDLEGDVSLFIADNGHGMDYEILLNAMRYGSPAPTTKASLGKFGLGMKTASTAFCRRLSVISRGKAKTEVNKFVWDLDHVISVKKWEVIRADPTKRELTLLDHTANSKSGTLVCWERVDRFFGREFQKPGGRAIKSALDKSIEGLEQHLAATYHRFLDPQDARARNLTISINGRQVQPWDPFGSSLPGRSVLADKPISVLLPNGVEKSFKLKAVVLPRQQDLDEAQRELLKPAAENQGFWIYRENRLIHHGGWLRIFRIEPHFSLLRLELDFGHELDDYFAIDIKKSQINLHSQIRDYLKNQFLPAPRREAELRYRYGKNKDALSKAEGGIHTSSGEVIEQHEKDLVQAQVQPLPNGKAQVLNVHGKTIIVLTQDTPGTHGELTVKPVESITDGLLWEPTIIDTHHAVRLNTSHPYYQRVYLPNRKEAVVVQGLDSLMWALCEAELAAVSDSSKGHMLEVRYEVSRILRRLADELPEDEDEPAEPADEGQVSSLDG
jgi:hypothetical protein